MAKWRMGLNYAGDGTDSFDFANATGRVLSIAQASGSLNWSAPGTATDVQLARGVAAGRLSLTSVSDARFTLNTTNGATTNDAVFEFQRGGTSKWQAGLNYAGNNADTFDFYSGGLALQLWTTFSVLIGKSAVATNATDGFPYIPANAGAPTGVPTAKAGFVPMYFDTTNAKLWCYTGGAWKGVVVA